MMVGGSNPVFVYLFFRKFLIPVHCLFVYHILYFHGFLLGSCKRTPCAHINKFEATLNGVCMSVICVYMCVCMILFRPIYIQAL